MPATLWRTCVAEWRLLAAVGRAPAAPQPHNIACSAGDVKGEEFIAGALCGGTIPEEIARTNWAAAA